MSKDKTPPASDSSNHKVRHVFDGIQEEDNDLPRWWLNMFYVCIVFSFGYMAWYHWPLGKGVSPEGEFAAEIAKLNENVAVAKTAGFDFAAVLDDQTFISGGKETFAQMCVPCHGDHGQGTIGPNLTDDFWLIDPTIAAVENIIANGNLEKGMPAWGQVVGPDKVRQLTVYVRSLRGLNVADGKASQGNPGKLP